MYQPLAFIRTHVTSQRPGANTWYIPLRFSLCISSFPLLPLHSSRIFRPFPFLPPRLSNLPSGGIRFELLIPPFESENTSYIFMKSVPLPFTAIFSSYERVFTRLRQHYLVNNPSNTSETR